MLTNIFDEEYVAEKMGCGCDELGLGISTG